MTIQIFAIIHNISFYIRWISYDKIKFRSFGGLFGDDLGEFGFDMIERNFEIFNSIFKQSEILYIQCVTNIDKQIFDVCQTCDFFVMFVSVGFLFCFDERSIIDNIIRVLKCFMIQIKLKLHHQRFSIEILQICFELEDGFGVSLGCKRGNFSSIDKILEIFLHA